MYLWANARKDLRRRLRDPLATTWLLLLPIVLVGLLIPLFGRSPRTDQHARLLVVDQDASDASRALLDLLDHAPFTSWLDVDARPEGTADDARERVAEGDVDAALIVPAGFGARVAAGEEARWELIADGRPLSSARIAERAARALTQLAPFVARSASSDALAALRASLAHAHVSIAPTYGEWAHDGGAGFTQLCFPSLLFLALFLMANSLSDDLWRERLEGTLLRARATPGGVRALIAGKLVAGSALFLLLGAVNLIPAALIFGFDPVRAVGATVWCGLVGTAFLALFLLLQIHASSARTASILTNVTVTPLVMLGGGVFPFELLPAGMGAVGRYTPNGWALEELRDVLWGAGSATTYALGTVCMLLFVVVLGVLLTRRVRRRFGVPR